MGDKHHKANQEGHQHEHGENQHHKHSHAHGHSHAHSLNHEHAPKVIRKAIIITVLFMLIELFGGWYANSLALISDGFHMLTDVAAMVLSLFALWIARRPKTHTMSFGYHRAEVLGALLSGLFIWFISGLLIYEAVLRLAEPPEVKAPVMLAIASIGLLANLVSMWMLRSARENINVRAAYLHMLSDSLGSISAIIAGVVLLYTGWRPIDPIVTVIFSILMLTSSWSLVKETIAVLMESTPNYLDPLQVKAELQQVTGAQEAHDLHIWSVTTGRLALSVHLISEDSETILHKANKFLKERYGIVHTTIQVEHPSRFQSERCYDCVPGE